MALSDRLVFRLEKALASRAAAFELRDEINGLGSVAAGVYPSTPGHLFTLGSADTDSGIIKGIVQYSAPTGIAAAGNSQGTATLLTAHTNNVTTVAASAGVELPVAAAGGKELYIQNSGLNALSVYPNTGAAINGLGANLPITVPVGGAVFVRAIAANTWQASVDSAINGVAPGYKIARGQHQQAAAADTIVTGLTTVIAAVASFESIPTINQLFITATVGNQAGAPAAGSIILKAFTATATGNVTPTPASNFSDNIKYNWIAIGT